MRRLLAAIVRRERTKRRQVAALHRTFPCCQLFLTAMSIRTRPGKKPKKKPPAPSEELIRLLSRYDLKVGELALALRTMVLEEVPDAVERLFQVYALVFWYSLTGRMGDAFCQVVIYPNGVNLMFNRGAELDDPDGVLVGEGKIIRHIKVRRPEDLKNPHLRKFIRAALKHAKLIAAGRRATVSRSAKGVTAKKGARR